MNRTAIMISVSSDIGSAMAHRWLQQGTKCLGTYRTWSPDVAGLAKAGVILAACDLGEPDSIRTGAAALIRLCGNWDVVMVCAGTLDPVGAFSDVDFDAWENSVRVNYLGALRMVHA